MKKSYLLFFFFLSLISCRPNSTILHLPDRKEQFPIYQYTIDEGCISFKRSPDTNKGETICNEKFWIETTVIDD